MAKGLLQTIRRNPIKALVFFSCSGTAILWSHNYTLDQHRLRFACQQAATYGDRYMKNHLAQPRHVTVILNPTAGGRKSKKLYQKWVAPMLHLAGIKVSLIETERPNQAFDLMKIMSNCDAVALVGGDGLVHEAINGLLDREDRIEATKRYPIAIMPTGYNNSIALHLYQNVVNYKNQKEFLLQSTMHFIRGATQQEDVLKVSPLDDELKRHRETCYAVRDVRFGKYQSDFYKVSGYHMFQQYLKPTWLRLKSTISKKFLLPAIESIQYTDACEGCSRCMDRHRLDAINRAAGQDQKTEARKWWSIMPSPTSKQQSSEDLKYKEMARRDNPQCNKWKQVQNSETVTDFRAAMVGQSTVGMSLSHNGDYSASESRDVQDARLRVAPTLDARMIDDAKTNLEKSDEKEQSESVGEQNENKTMMLIDGQPVQAHSVEITAISKAITVFNVWSVDSLKIA